MKKVLLLILSITSLLLATSCTNDENDVAILELSTKNVVLSSGITEATVMVTTDQEDWSAIGTADWMQVTCTGATLKITATENLEGKIRKSIILVVAGNSNTLLEVTQDPSNTNTTITEKFVELEAKAGKYTIDIVTKAKWEATTDAEWITLTPKPYKSELIVAFTENTDKVAREAKVFVTIGDKKQEILIVQDGKMFYILPYLELDCTIKPIMEYELARGSASIKIPDGYFNPDLWDFGTRSPLFSVMRYKVTNSECKSVIAYADTPEIMQAELENFKAFLIENGWEKEDELVFVNKSLSEKYIATATIEKSMVKYNLTPVQDKDYATFNEFPYGFLKDGKWAVQKDKIDEYEANNEGTYDEEKSGRQKEEHPYIYLRYNVNKEKIDFRAYLIFDDPNSIGITPGLGQAMLYYKEMNLAFYEYNQQLYFTREFLALCKAEGWKYLEPSGRYQQFVNNKRKLYMNIGWIKYSDMDYPVLAIVLFEKTTEDEEGAKSFHLPEDRKIEYIKTPIFQ